MISQQKKHQIAAALAAAQQALEEGREFQGEVLEVIAQVREAREVLRSMRSQKACCSVERRKREDSR